MLRKASVPVALLAITVAGFAAHNRLTVQSRPRTVLGGNVFEDTRNNTGQRSVQGRRLSLPTCVADVRCTSSQKKR